VTARVRAADHVSAAQARAIALAAQGFADARPAGRIDARHRRRVVDRLGVLQIDSVNVLARAHYLPLFSRLGPYAPDLLDRGSMRAPRELFEYWGHEASLLPVDLHPFLRWRMERAAQEAWGGMRAVADEHPHLLADLLASLDRDGPATAGGLEQRVMGERVRRRGSWWDWSQVKRAVEFLFWAGEVTTAERVGFERVYDLPDRVLPAAVLAAPTPDPADAQQHLVARSAQAMGIATARDLRDYYRLPRADALAAIAALVEDGVVLPVSVEGWRAPAYLHRDARRPRPGTIRANALLAPFDPLVWERDRTERLFGMRLRLEIYVPAPKRVHGYYVLPFLHGDALTARVDLKADRAASVLRVLATHDESTATDASATALADELRTMASWLGLAAVAVSSRGSGARRLKTLVR
jgi:uncharacterized protein YcaQ